MRQYTTRDAGKRIGVTQVAIQQAIYRGQVIAFKMGRDWLVDEKELDRWNGVRRKRVA